MNERNINQINKVPTGCNNYYGKVHKYYGPDLETTINNGRYVEFNAAPGGLANIMFGLVSSYVIAELLNAKLISNNYNINNSIVPYNATRKLFEITDLSDKLVLYERPNNLPNPYYFKQNNYCFSNGSDIARNIINVDIHSVFASPYLIIQTNCPLFTWLTYNKKTYEALIRLGILENKPFESAHPAVYGFQVLSYVMRKHVRISSILLSKLNMRKKDLQNGNCISFHVRMGDSKSDFQEKRYFIDVTDLMSFSHCQVVNDNPRYSIFLSSDSSYAKSIIINNTSHRKFISYDKKAIHSTISSFSLASESTETSLLDILTLGSCKELVGTYSSTFSILAASLIGKVPYLVARNKSCFVPQDYFYKG